LIDLVPNLICVGCLELLFFRSEMKMAAPDAEFTTKESTAVMKFLFLQGKLSKEIYGDIMSLTLGEKGPSYSTVKNWVAPFKAGHFGTDDEDRPERPLLSLCLKMWISFTA
jgi:hypothetical protein